MKKEKYIKKAVKDVQKYISLPSGLCIKVKKTEAMKKNPCITGTIFPFSKHVMEIRLNPLLFTKRRRKASCSSYEDIKFQQLVALH